VPPDDHAHNVSPTPTQDLEIALRALDQGDAKHAAHHLASVVGVDPSHEGLDTALERLIAAASDPLALVEVGDGAYLGLFALRALVLAHLARPAEACPLLLRVQQERPEAPYLVRVRDWMQREGTVPAMNLGAFASAANPCVNHPHLARDILPLLEQLIAHREPHDMVVFTAVRAARNAGQPDKAVAIARAAEQRAPTYWTSISLGMALKAKEKPEEAVAAFREAASRDPRDAAALLDVGDISLDSGDHRAAREAYEAALRRDPQKKWARESLLYLQWRFEGDHAAREELRRLATADRSSRANQLAWRTDPYAHFALVPGSSVANGLRTALQRKLTVTRMAVSSLEAPSVLLGVRLASRGSGVSVSSIEFGEIPSPDPRVSRRRVDFALWTYGAAGLGGLLGAKTTMARPNVPSPAEPVARAIDDIARTRYDLEAWAPRCFELARTIAAPPKEIAATMVHPGDPPQGTDAFEWIFCRQIAAALVLAGIDEGWPGSQRRAALTSLLYGPVDWTTTAGLIALVEIARREPQHASDIVPALVDELDGTINPIRWSCIMAPLLTLIERVEIGEDLRRKLARKRAEAAPGDDLSV
jgi:tetratricopeptide (TPR) repeat protein